MPVQLGLSTVSKKSELGEKLSDPSDLTALVNVNAVLTAFHIARQAGARE